MQNPSPLISALTLALQAYQGAQYSACLAHSERALAIDPRQADGLHFKALALGYLRSGADVDTAFSKAAKASPRPFEVQNNFANYLLRYDEVGRAIKALQACLAKFPKFTAGWANLSVAYSRDGELQKAQTACEKALALEPKNSIARTEFGKVLLEVGEYKRAKLILDAELTDRPRNAVAQSLLGGVLKQMGQLNVARQHHLLAVKNAPENGALWHGLARAHQRTGHLDEALHAYERAIDLKPDDIAMHQDYARLRWELGDQSGYLVSLNTMIDRGRDGIGHDLGALLVAKADLAKMGGDVEGALEALAQVADDSPSRRAALILRGELFGYLGENVAAEHQLETAYTESRTDPETAQAYASFLLSQSRFNEAEAALSAYHPEHQHLQKHIGLLALALRGQGREEYQRWYDYDRFTTARILTPPPRYSSLEVFLGAVRERLAPQFETKHAPLDQTLFGGVQTQGHLWDTQDQVLLELRDALFEVTCGFVADLPEDDTHPFLKQRPRKDEIRQRLAFSSAWAVKLASGGGHVDHIHPDGWISSAHYLSVPDDLGPNNLGPNDQDGRPGWLRLGASGIRGLDMKPEKYIKPEPGMLILFASYIWHGVERFESNQPRITTPFDIKVR